MGMLHAGLLRDPPSDSPTAQPQVPADWAARMATLARQARDPRLQAFYAAGAVSPDTPLQQVPLPMGDESVTIHGITHQQIRQAPDLDEVLHEVLALMAGHVMVVHCRDIERHFLASALRRRIGEGIEFPVIDTMELEARLYRRPPLPWWRRLLRARAAPVSIRLAASRARYGLPRYRLHHALTDALASAELLQAQVADRFSPETPIATLWR